MVKPEAHFYFSFLSHSVSLFLCWNSFSPVLLTLGKDDCDDVCYFKFSSMNHVHCISSWSCMQCMSLFGSQCSMSSSEIFILIANIGGTQQFN